MENNIVLTYKGDDKYKTHLGGIISIVLVSTILVYIAYLFKVMFGKENTSFFKTSLLNDVSSKVEIIRPGLNGFDFNFQFLSGDNVDYTKDTSVLDIAISEVDQIWVKKGNASTTQRNTTQFQFDTWNTSFSYPDQNEVIKLGMDKYQWLTNKNYSVAGTYYSSNFNYLQIRVKKWMSQSYWKTTDQINSIINGGRFSMGIANTIVDVKNYNQAIQYMIDDGFYWDLVSGFRKRTDIYIRKNSVQFNDNYIQLGFTDNESFFQVVESTSSFSQESSSGEILSIYFRYDKYTDSYQRRIYSLGEVLGQAGGFYGSLLAIGSALVFIFTERLFVTSVLRKIYQIDTWQEKEMLTKGPGAEKEHIKAAKGVVDGQQPITNKKFPVSQSEKFHSQAAEDIKHFLNKHHYDHDQK